MTRCILYRDAEGRYTGFEVSGHSGYAEAGSDIVCAAVSILTTTCVNALEAVAGVTPMIRGGTDGMLGVTLPSPLPPDKLHDCQVLLKALRQGLADLSEGYPKYVRLSIQERRETSC